MNWLLLKNSLLVSSCATVLAVSFGFIAALFLAGLEKRWRNRLLALSIATLALPPFLVTNSWLHFFGYTGAWREWLPLNIFSLGGAIWILSLLLWPITLVAVLSSWQRLEAPQLEADMAVSGWALVRHLLMPVASGALAQAAVLTFVLALNNFAVPAILQVKVFPAEMWVRFSTTFDTLGALQLSWPLVLGPLLLVLWFARREVQWPRVEGPVSPRLLRQQLGRTWFSRCGAVSVGLLGLSLGLPLLQLIFVKRTWTELPGALATGQGAVWESLWLASASAIVVVMIGSAAGMWSMGLAGKPPRPRLLVQFVSWALWLPLLVPGVLLGIAFIFVFNRPVLSALYQSTAIIILAFAVRYLALGWHVAGHALRTTDPNLTDVARLSGATRWQMMRYVHWPQIGAQVAGVWYIVYLLCLWDVESMVLIVPPGGETLALRIFNLLHYGHNAQVNALCLTLLVLAIGPLVVWKGYGSMLGLMRQVPFGRFKALKIVPGAGFALLVFSFVLFTGCTQNVNSNEAALGSQLFSHAEIIGSRGVGLGQLNKPRSVAVDKEDNLYVVDMTGRVQKFSPKGTFFLSWQMPQTDLGKPKGMCRDRDGNIVVVEPHYQRVNHFTPAGKLVRQWGQRGTNVGQFTLPRAVAVNSRREAFVSEYGGAERVQRFSPDGKVLKSIGAAGNGTGEFNRPEGLCIDNRDNVYVADSCNHRIQVFSSEGKFIRAYGKPGTGKGELSYPYDICVDEAGRQFVCEFGNSRIQVFDAHDRPIETIGGSGAAPGQFSNPWGVALDSVGNLYVADSQNHRVQKLVRRETAQLTHVASRQ